MATDDPYLSYLDFEFLGLPLGLKVIIFFGIVTIFLSLILFLVFSAFSGKRKKSLDSSDANPTDKLSYDEDVFVSLRIELHKNKTANELLKFAKSQDIISSSGHQKLTKYYTQQKKKIIKELKDFADDEFHYIVTALNKIEKTTVFKKETKEIEEINEKLASSLSKSSSDSLFSGLNLESQTSEAPTSLSNMNTKQTKPVAIEDSKFDIPSPSSAVSIPTPPASIPTPSASIPTPPASIPTPSASIPTPPASIPTPSASIPTPPASIPTPSASIPTPPASIPTPSASIPTPPASIPTPSASIPTPPASIPTPSASIPTPPASIPTPPASTSSPKGVSSSQFSDDSKNLEQDEPVQAANPLETIKVSPDKFSQTSSIAALRSDMLRELARIRKYQDAEN